MTIADLDLDLAMAEQRAQIERDLRRHRGQMEDMRFCPVCFPALFDAALEFTPAPVFCPHHAAAFLQAGLGLRIERDADGVARPRPAA